MVITYYGIECFKVQFGDTVIALNPISKKSTFKAPRFSADVALVSLDHEDMNGVEEVNRGDEEVFIIRGPGEYEVQGVRVRGFPTTTSYGGDETLNTIYTFELEDMLLGYLGALSENNLEGEIQEAFDNIDVLFIPIGGDGVLSPKDAHQLGVKLSARVIIPMHYGEVGTKDALTTFLKEEGEKKGAPEEKLTLKKADLANSEGDIIVLEPVVSQ